MHIECRHLSHWKRWEEEKEKERPTDTKIFLNAMSVIVIYYNGFERKLSDKPKICDSNRLWNIFMKASHLNYCSSFRVHMGRPAVLLNIQSRLCWIWCVYFVTLLRLWDHVCLNVVDIFPVVLVSYCTPYFVKHTKPTHK